MKLLYFTLGTSLLDEKVRQQLVRIPEVLSEIRKSEGSADPILAFLNLQKTEFEKWVPVIQRGLFQRFQKMGFQYCRLIRRSGFQNTENFEQVLQALLSSKSTLDIFVLGPGFDDLKKTLDHLQRRLNTCCEVRLFDVISLDHRLNWFWTELLTSIVDQAHH